MKHSDVTAWEVTGIVPCLQFRLRALFPPLTQTVLSSAHIHYYCRRIAIRMDGDGDDDDDPMRFLKGLERLSNNQKKSQTTLEILLCVGVPFLNRIAKRVPLPDKGCG